MGRLGQSKRDTKRGLHFFVAAKAAIAAVAGQSNEALRDIYLSK